MSFHLSVQCWISVRKAAAILGVNVKSVYKAIRRGELQSRSLGRRILVPLAAVLPEGEAAPGISVCKECSEK